MKLGIQIPHFGPHARPEAVTEVAVRAEAGGLDSVWVSDHVVLPSKTTDYPYSKGGLPVENLSPMYEALTTLAFVAGQTSRVKLGTSILVLPQREPVLVAKMLATLDVLSAGRVILGVGAGWLPEEFALLNSPWFPERGAALDEMIELLTTLWSRSPVGFKGERYELQEMIFDPLPQQRPRPPIWVGGNSRPALRRAARLGDAWHAARVSPDEFAVSLTVLRELVQEAGRRPEEVEGTVTCLLRISDVTSDPRRQRDLVGPPALIVDLLDDYARAGATTMVMGTDPRETVEQRLAALDIVTDEIAPAFRERLVRRQATNAGGPLGN